MNILNRAFTKTEKILLVLLFLVIIAASYYLFVLTPIENAITSSKQEQNALTTELAATKNKIDSMQAMTEDIEANKNSKLSYLPSYNAGKQELDFLHDTLDRTQDYTVRFTNLTREGDLIRREWEMSFTVNSFAAAEKIIEKLEGSENRCLINDMVVTPRQLGTNLNDDEVTVRLTGTFYETMHDGTPDKELPEDSLKE
ncbi:hypothetical protein [Butyrivibrio sp. INlla16]|uniref:hypothetical protein n=1 Tax=Butyrivibrio sp. INlla16 TaxID=1520807 RepID=UPI00088B2EA4|nr:hypothetical protein [Butyrivibrio sp. INlla16]SDB15026.1 hypothetical protein SAMN02910263_00722 [Butyrivibrio sp. INlla16]